MSEYHRSSLQNPNPYIPKSLSEIYDMLGSMLLGAPTFVDPTGVFWDRNIDSEFYVLTESFGLVQKKLGEARYAKVIDLAVRAKALFAADPKDENGKADEGRALLYEIESVIQELRSDRTKAKNLDDEGEISGD